MAGHHEVAGRAAAVAAADLAGWGGFATVLTALLALAAGSGWIAALTLCCLGGLATTALCWAAGPVRVAGTTEPALTDGPAVASDDAARRGRALGGRTPPSA